MDLPGRTQLLETAQHICVQHGFDREAFLCLMESSYGKRIEAPEQVSQQQLQQFLMASLSWACPPETPVMRSRRAEALKSWAEASEGSLPAAA